MENVLTREATTEPTRMSCEASAGSEDSKARIVLFHTSAYIALALVVQRGTAKIVELGKTAALCRG